MSAPSLRLRATVARALVLSVFALPGVAHAQGTTPVPGTTATATPSPTPSPTTTPTATPIPTVTPSPTATPGPTTETPSPIPTGRQDAAWILPDRLLERIDGQWQRSRRIYLDRGGVSIRANAMLLELHALAALAGHTGPARQDARIAGLVRFFTTPPVVVYRTTTKRSTASFPHTPAWESVFRGDSTKAILHPSADAIVARALATAYRARDVAGLPAEDSERIRQVVGAVARGQWYKAPTRAENQINWNTDLYAANLEVTGDRSNLPDYRAHLKWFIDHAFRKAYKGGSSNLSRGYGFRYLPQYDGGVANTIDTVEYANLVHTTLGFYSSAVRAGMRPLNARQIRQLKAWSRHVLFGTWTHGGYLNWDSGLGSARRHVRQYWAFALDALIRASGPGALLGSPDQRGYVRYIADRGLELFRSTAWDGQGALPSATSFGAPNGFPAGTKSPLITPLRFAVLAASLDVRLPATKPKAPPNIYSHDAEFGRLAISTPAYNTAVVRPAGQGEGGLEPTRLFDSRQRPLTTLAAGGFGGPSLGLRLARGGSTVLEDQPGTLTRGRVPGMSVGGAHRNRAGTFTSLTAGATIRDGKASVAVQHRFRGAAVETKFRVVRGAGTNITLRIPVWGRDSTIELLRGGAVDGKQLKRTDGAILMRGTTPAGAVMLVAVRGVPRRATLVVVRHGRSSRAPSGARELRIRFKAAKVMRLERRIAVVASAP